FSMTLCHALADLLGLLSYLLLLFGQLSRIWIFGVPLLSKLNTGSLLSLIKSLTLFFEFRQLTIQSRHGIAKYSRPVCQDFSLSGAQSIGQLSLFFFEVRSFLYQLHRKCSERVQFSELLCRT